MADFTEKDEKKHISRSILLQICIFLLLILISTPLLRPIQTAISGEIHNIRKNYIEKIEKLTGREITYSSIRPSLLGSIDIRNLKILYRNPDNSLDEFISIPNLKFSFSLLKLLSGNKSAIKKILIDHPVISLDSKRDIDIYRRLIQSSPDNDSEKTIKLIAQYLPKEPEFIIRAGSLRLNGDGAVCQILALNIGIFGNENEITLDGKFNGYFYKPSFLNRTAGVRSSVTINGSCTLGLENARAQIKFEPFKSDETPELSLILEPAAEKSINLGLYISNGNLFLITSGENLPYFCSLNYEMDTGRAELQASFNKFTPGEYAAFSLKEANQFLFQTVSGNASLNYANRRDFNYNIALNGFDRVHSNEIFSAQMSGGDKMISIDNLKITASPLIADYGLFKGSLSLDGKINFQEVSADGNVFFKDFSLSGLSNFNADLRVSSLENENYMLSGAVSFGEMELDNFDMKVYPSSGNIGVTLSAECENGAIKIDSAFNGAQRQIEAGVALDSFSVMNITRIVKPFVREFNVPQAADHYMEKALVNADVFFSTNFNQIMYNAPDINITYSGNTDIDTLINISISGTDKRLNLNEGFISRNGRDMRFSSLVNFSRPNDLDFSLNADYQDTHWQIEGQVVDRSAFMLNSSNGLQAYGNMSPSGFVSGFIEAVNFPLLINDNVADIDFFISLRFETHNTWSLDIARVECRDFLPKYNKSILRFSGAADQSGARIENVFYSDDISSLEGSVYSSWSPDFSNCGVIINLDEVSTEALQKNNECYNLEGKYEDKRLDLNMTVNAMRLDRFLSGNNYALLDAQMALSWASVSSFQADIDLSSLYIRTQDKVIQSSAGMRLNNDDILIYNLKADYSGLAASVGEFFISRTDNTARANAELKGNLLGKKLEGRFILDARFIPLESWYQLKKTLDSFNGVIKVENLVYGDVLSQQPFSISLVRNNTELSILGGPKNMFRLEMDGEGDFFACVSSPSPLRVSVTGRLEDNFIDARLNDFYLDMRALWSLAPDMPVINMTGGYITGNLDIRGPVSNPVFSGGAKASSLKLLIPRFVRQEIKCVPFDITVENNEISFGPVLSKSGSGGAAISGQIGVQQWLPVSLALDITVPRESPVPYQFDVVNFISNGEASGKMSIYFDSSGLDIKGDFFANNTEMSMANDDILNSRANREGPEKKIVPVTADITITTGSSVEFIWPNTRFPILTANPEIGTVFKVNADTITGQYNLTGDIKIRSGEIYYFDRNFYIRQGVLVFRENEREFNPRISARAEIRDRLDSGPVTISMIIDNEPLLKFMPRFESNPALTQLEIYSLLGQNSIQMMEDIEMAQRFFLNSTADILSQFIRVRPLERQIRNFLRMDMFSVRTQILHNFALNASGLGQFPVDTNYSVGNYLDNTTFFGGKYIGQNMFIQGMFALKYDRNTAVFYGLRAEPDIGIELQSPFVNVRWNLLGFWDYGLEIENSISLTWDFIF